MPMIAAKDGTLVPALLVGPRGDADTYLQMQRLIQEGHAADRRFAAERRGHVMEASRDATGITIEASVPGRLTFRAHAPEITEMQRGRELGAGERFSIPVEQLPSVRPLTVTLTFQTESGRIQTQEFIIEEPPAPAGDEEEVQLA